MFNALYVLDTASVREFIDENKLDYSYLKDGTVKITKYKIAKNCYLALSVCWKEFADEIETTVINNLFAYFCDDLPLLVSNLGYLQIFKGLKSWKGKEELTDKFWAIFSSNGMGYDKILFKNIDDDFLSILELCIIQKDRDLVSKLFMVINCILGFKDEKKDANLERFITKLKRILEKHKQLQNL